MHDEEGAELDHWVPGQGSKQIGGRMGCYIMEASRAKCFVLCFLLSSNSCSQHLAESTEGL